MEEKKEKKKYQRKHNVWMCARFLEWVHKVATQ